MIPTDLNTINATPLFEKGGSEKGVKFRTLCLKSGGGKIQSTIIQDADNLKLIQEFSRINLDL